MCGIAGIVYDSPGAEGPDWVELQAALKKIPDQAAIPGAPPKALLDRLEAAAVGLRELAAFETLWQRPDLTRLLATGAQDLQEWERRTRESVLAPSGAVPTDLLERWNSLWVRSRDLAWGLERDVLGSLERARRLLPEGLGADARARREAWKMTAVLENIGRMEVRGRDSLGISGQVAFDTPEAYQRFLAQVAKAGLEAQWAERRNRKDLVDLALRVDETSARPCILFAYKVAQEVGALGDNVHALREELRADELMWMAFTAPDATTNVWSHTRWASNGIISQANCHPVDEETLDDAGGLANGPWITAALNGDVDNYQDLAARLQRETGRRLSPRITTDA